MIKNSVKLTKITYRRIKNYYKNNKDTILQHHKEYCKLNKDKLNNYNNDWYRNQINKTPIYRLIKHNRSRIYHILKSNSNASNYIDLLGCSRKFHWQWIKFNLPYDMSDEELKTLFHIDHVVAIANFDFKNEENQFIAFNWQNTRLLLKIKILVKELNVIYRVK